MPDPLVIPLPNGYEVSVIRFNNTGLFEAVLWDNAGNGIRSKILSFEELPAFVEEGRVINA